MDLMLRQRAAGLLPLIPGAEYTLLNAMASDSLRSLLATNKQLRRSVSTFVTSIRITNFKSVPAFDNWPNLIQLCLSGAIERTSRTGQQYALLAQGKLPNLQALDVSFDDLYPSEARQLALADWPFLTSLNLRSANSGRDCAETCQHLASGNWTQLAALNYSLNRMTAACLSEFVKGAWPLKQLDVSDNGDYFYGSMKVLVTSAWDGLKELNLANNKMTDDDCQQLRVANWPRLISLKISFTMPHRGMADLATAKLPSLAQLDLSCHTMLADDFQSLSDSEWPSLTYLTFGNSPALFCTMVSWTLVNPPRCQRLRFLSEQYISVLAQGNWPILQELHFPCSHIASHMRTTLQPLFERWPMLKVHHQHGVEAYNNNNNLQVCQPMLGTY